MGDRSNIILDMGNDSKIYLYGHWMGDRSIDILHEALSKGERWNDEPYLARMIFSAMVKDDIDGSTGYGLATYPQDEDYGNPPLIVNCSDQTVTISGYDYEATCSFSEFVEKADGCGFRDLCLALDGVVPDEDEEEE